MYQSIVRPILFRLDPEKAHDLTFKALKLGQALPAVPQLVEAACAVKNIKLERDVFGLHFPNPVGLAAGLDKNAVAYEMFGNMGFGFVEIGTVTPKPQAGNPKPRLFRLVADKALINRMGFNNLGVDNAVENLKKRKRKMIIGGNIGKNTATANEDAVGDYLFCFNKLFDVVDYFVVNVSCPNVANLHKLQDTDSLNQILESIQAINLKKTKPKPVLLKIAPDLTTSQLDEIVEIVHSSKIAGLVASNTTTWRTELSIPESRIKEIGNGGLSGSPLTKRSTEMIRYISEKSGGSIPIIGVGGIMSVQDALDRLNAGASLIQLYSGFIYGGTGLVKNICKSLLSKNV